MYAIKQQNHKFIAVIKIDGRTVTLPKAYASNRTAEGAALRFISRAQWGSK